MASSRCFSGYNVPQIPANNSDAHHYENPNAFWQQFDQPQMLSRQLWRKTSYSLLACSTPHCLLLQTITSQCCKVSVSLRLSENEFEKCGVRKNFVTTKWMDSYQANRFQDNAKGNRLDIATGREFFQLAWFYCVSLSLCILPSPALVRHDCRWLI